VTTACGDGGRRRPVGYAPWTPRNQARELLDQITELLDDLRAYWPITPRQILYRLMGRGIAAKDDADRVGEVLVRARRAGLAPWEAIGDDRTESSIPRAYNDPAHFYASLEGAALAYRLDRQRGQDPYIEVFVEASGAVDQVFATTAQYGVPVYSGSGFNTVTALREVAVRAARRETDTRLLILGDYDPAGQFIRERVAAEVEAFAGEHGAYIEVQTVALTLDQIAKLALIKQPMPAKKRARYPTWPHNWTVEIEAMAPDGLARVLRESIEALIDDETRQAVLWQEQRERAEVLRHLNGGTAHGE
jgi:hypothetical protein